MKTTAELLNAAATMIEANGAGPDSRWEGRPGWRGLVAELRTRAATIIDRESGAMKGGSPSSSFAYRKSPPRNVPDCDAVDGGVWIPRMIEDVSEPVDADQVARAEQLTADYEWLNEKEKENSPRNVPDCDAVAGPAWIAGDRLPAAVPKSIGIGGGEFVASIFVVVTLSTVLVEIVRWWLF